MSENRNKVNGRHGGGFGGGPMSSFAGPKVKVKDFKGTLKRLLNYLKPQRIKFVLVFIFAIMSTIFNIVGPKISGKAVTRLVEGIVAKYTAIAQNAALIKAGKQGNIPIPGIDFQYIGDILLLLLGLYIISTVFGFLQQYIMAGVAQKTVYNLRKEVEDKLSRLPLKFFDSRTHGEILSRVTNDVDNISTTLQQSLTQLITSLVTIIGIIIMMLTISPIMTLVVILTLPKRI